MRLFPKIDARIDRFDRGFLFGSEPFDLGSAGHATFRAGARAIFRPGVQDGLVWPWSVFGSRVGNWPVRPIICGTVREDADATILAYCLTAAGTPLVQADVLGLATQVTDMRTGTAVPGHAWATLSPADTVFDTPQTAALDARWNRGGGANFIHRLPATAWPAAGRRYRYQCQVTEVGGAVWYLAAELWCQAVLRS